MNKQRNKPPHSVFNPSLFSSQGPIWFPLAFILALSGMAWMSWRKWPDLVIDFGEQVYIAWRLAEGEVLYRDIIYFYGPLSSYLHGLLFKLFGPGFMVLATFNILLVIVLTSLIYHSFTFFGNRLSGTLSALTFVTVFAFSQYIWMGNHNFMASYVYDLTHGAFLCFLAIHLLIKFSLKGTPAQSAGLGLLTGLIFLTKFEVFLAWITALTLAWILFFNYSRLHRENFSRLLPAFLFTSVVPPGLFFCYFSLHMPMASAFEAMIGPWTYVLSSSVRSLQFYQYVMGTDALLPNVKMMAIYFFYWALILMAMILFSRFSNKIFKNSVIFNLIFLALLAGLLILFREKIPWMEALRPLPVILILSGIYLYFTRANYLDDPIQLSKFIILATVITFSLVLLTKIIFNVHVYHYGVVLALPATLVLIHILFYELPLRVPQISNGDGFYKPAALILFFIFIYSHVQLSSDFYGKKIFPVGKGSDMIMGYDRSVGPRDMMVQIALEVLEEEVQPDEGFATFPTGTLLNYLSRRVNPINSLSFNPGTLTLVGEQAVLESLEAHPPAYVVIIFFDFLQFEYRFFGRDFGQGIYSWIQSNYVLFRQIGKDPVQDKAFGIQIFKRKTAG